jgi:hypothetical protein
MGTYNRIVIIWGLSPHFYKGGTEPPPSPSFDTANHTLKNIWSSALSLSPSLFFAVSLPLMGTYNNMGTL